MNLELLLITLASTALGLGVGYFIGKNISSTESKEALDRLRLEANLELLDGECPLDTASRISIIGIIKKETTYNPEDVEFPKGTKL
tara:strand:+ start:1244 stop:1501 length:258 start_codon:yes stop_codon:yes gene_type:complete